MTLPDPNTFSALSVYLPISPLSLRPFLSVSVCVSVSLPPFLSVSVCVFVWLSMGEGRGQHKVARIITYTPADPRNRILPCGQPVSLTRDHTHTHSTRAHFPTHMWESDAGPIQRSVMGSSMFLVGGGGLHKAAQGFMAGAYVALGALFANLMEAGFKSSVLPGLSNLVGGAVFPVGR